MFKKLAKAKGRTQKYPDYTKVFKRIAARNSTTVAEVRHNMQEAIRIGMQNPDPAVRAAWARIPREGDMPTPEEMVACLAAQTRQGNMDALLHRFFHW